MTPEMQSLFDKNIASSFDKQMHLDELIRGLPWSFSMQTGLLTFGDKYSFKAQVLGTESQHSGSWLWAWANQASPVPEFLLSAAKGLKAFGAQKSVRELTMPEFMIGTVTGEAVALAASGLCKSAAYYKGVYDGGAVFLLIMDPQFPARQDPNPLARIPQVLTKVISFFTVNHRRVFLSYVRWYGLEAVDRGDVFEVRDSAGNMMTTEFDWEGRLLSFDGRAIVLQAPPQPPAMQGSGQMPRIQSGPNIVGGTPGHKPGTAPGVLPVDNRPRTTKKNRYRKPRRYS